MGNYSLEWLDTFYRFMTGQEAKDRIGKPKAREWPPIKVLFPSLATVENSALGKEVSFPTKNQVMAHVCRVEGRCLWGAVGKGSRNICFMMPIRSEVEF